MIFTAHLILANVLFVGLLKCNAVDLDETETIPVKISLHRNGLWRLEDAHVFQIKAFGQVFTLYLWPDDSFMAPVLHIQRVKVKQLSSVVNGPGADRALEDVVPEPTHSEHELRGCFHTGIVNKDEESLVSVSLCRGIRGTFITRGQEYFIEPVSAHTGDTRWTFYQPHVVKRRVLSRKSSVEGKEEDNIYMKHGIDHSDEYEQTGRKGEKRERRFVSAARYIETLVVADASMTRFYGDEVKHYLLTIMGMAAQLFGHPSIKNAVGLVVVKMLIVEDVDVGPEVSRNGGMTLRNFCAWQQLFNPASPRHPEHYDTAILFTREDICGHQHCDTLGVADVGTMCDPKRSCSVIEDNGLQAAFTVSHELGHVLSMPHDDSKSCEKLFGGIDGNHIMAPFFVHLNKTLPWSPCSALYITEFFDSGHVVMDRLMIETLVVADASMTRFYGDEVKHYLLTIMGMAAQLFGHPSIKNAVGLVVVKMLIVEDVDVGPEVSRNGGMTLRNFCAWQQLFNPASPRHPEHYDTAILFTREDICGHQHCDTLGVADVGTMCDPKRSCSVIEDNGLQAAFTVSHELGHVLSMPHDDSKSCEKLFGGIDGNHIMAPFFVHLNKTLPWSPCSALYITEFFDSGHGDCLLDMPHQTIPLKANLGHMFGLDRQCQQAFGEEFLHCPNAPEDQACIQLWCHEEGKIQCTTRNGSLPWADGTPCGEDQSCHGGVCLSSILVKKQEEEPVNGAWSAWGNWGPCSRSCGGGIQFSQRECTDPTPKNGGSYCVGQRVKYQSCSIQICPGNHGKSFREEQCEKYNSDHYLNVEGKIKTWIPKYAGVSPRDRCKLFCRAQHSNEFKVFEAKVVDGTTCGPDTTSVCVQGQCVKAGCDQVIGSSLRLDKCGVCGGDGSSCRKISGTLTKAMFGYNDIITIPAGATNIDIKQRSHNGIRHDGNYLAVKAGDENYILNGNFSVSTAEQDIPVRGAILRYSGSSTTLERLLSFQVLQEPITIQLLSTAGDTLPPRVKYTFYLPRNLPFSKPAERSISPHIILPFGGAEWVLGEWSKCSKSCGAGWSRRSVECQDRTGAPSFSCDIELRPTDIKPCGDLPCPVWQMGQWSACSQTCGTGERWRSVLCIDYTGKTVEPEICNPDTRPEAVSTECFYQEC